MDYLCECAHNIIGVTKGILDRGGWDPVRFEDAARPGETPAQAKNRLAGVRSQEHDPASASDATQGQENRGHDLNRITSTIQRNMRMYPQNPEFVTPDFERLKELSPEDPLIQQFENHKKAAAGTAA